MGSGAASGRLSDAVRTLAPGYFALVMASGIISVGLRQHGQKLLSDVLLVVCSAAYAVLLVLNCWRIATYRGAVAADFTDPARGFGFFTFIAGSNVLGVRLGMEGRYAATGVLLAVSGACWLVLGYVIPWTAVIGSRRRRLLAAANGSWFVWVVACQSVTVAAAGLEAVTPSLRVALAAVAIFCWSVGVFLYAAIGVVVSVRLLLFTLHPTDLTPPYWVTMGATAISVLAGARVVEMADTPMVRATRGLVAGVAVLLWAFGTWLIPVLLAAGWWRHRVHHVPLVYESSLWSMVFPFGMYSVAGTYLGDADRLPLVGAVGAVGIWVALAVWAVTFAAMAVHLARTVILPQRARPADTARREEPSDRSVGVGRSE